MLPKLVSVIIPAHNGEKYIQEAIKSVLAQTYLFYEIIVVNNGSIDKTAEIVKNMSDVVCIESDIPHTAVARNIGSQHAKGEYLAFLDQDDLWVSDKLEKQVTFLDQHPEYGAVIGYQALFLEQGCEKPSWLKEKFLASPQPGYLPSALLVRHEIVKKHHYFDTNFAYASDVAWFFEMKNKGLLVHMLPDTLVKRRIHDENNSAKCKAIHAELLAVIKKSLTERRNFNGGDRIRSDCTQPLISVIISVYNGENYIAEAIESVLNQSYQNIELIVIDDGSTDNTETILHSFGNKLRYYHQKNQGLGAGRNQGIRLAQGEFITFLDHDDLWVKDKLLLQYHLWEKEKPQDSIIFGHVKQFICPRLTQEESALLKVNQNAMPGKIAGTLLLTKKRFLEIGYFIEKNEVGEFVEWYQRALQLGSSLETLEKVLLYRRVHRTNMGRQKEQYHRSHYLQILKSGLDRSRQKETA